MEENFETFKQQLETHCSNLLIDIQAYFVYSLMIFNSSLTSC